MSRSGSKAFWAVMDARHRAGDQSTQISYDLRDMLPGILTNEELWQGAAHVCRMLMGLLSDDEVKSVVSEAPEETRALVEMIMEVLMTFLMHPDNPENQSDEGLSPIAIMIAEAIVEHPEAAFTQPAAQEVDPATHTRIERLLNEEEKKNNPQAQTYRPGNYL